MDISATVIALLTLGAIGLLAWAFGAFRKRRQNRKLQAIQIEGFGIITYWKPNEAEAKALAPQLVVVRDLLWPELEAIYEQHGVWHIDTIHLVPSPWPDDAEHRGAELMRVSGKMTLELGGFGGRDEVYWFAGECHNLFRYQIGLPYRPTPDERVRYNQAMVAWKHFGSST